MTTKMENKHLYDIIRELSGILPSASSMNEVTCVRRSLYKLSKEYGFVMNEIYAAASAGRRSLNFSQKALRIHGIKDYYAFVSVLNHFGYDVESNFYVPINDVVAEDTNYISISWG